MTMGMKRITTTSIILSVSGLDDALKAEIFSIENLPEQMAFDHKEILNDYLNNKY